MRGLAGATFAPCKHAMDPALTEACHERLRHTGAHTCSLSEALGVVGVTLSLMPLCPFSAILSRAMWRASSCLNRPPGAGLACLHTWPTTEGMTSEPIAATVNCKREGTCTPSRQSRPWTSTTQTGRPQRSCGITQTTSGQGAVDPRPAVRVRH